MSCSEHDNTQQVRRKIQAGKHVMYPVPNAGKHVTGVRCGKKILSVKRRKACNEYRNLYQARKDTYPVPYAKRGKICSRCEARENTQTVPSAGKDVPYAKRGKTCNWCQARGKYVLSVKCTRALKTGCSSGKINGTVHSIESFSGKKVIFSKVLLFSGFHLYDRNFFLPRTTLQLESAKH